MGKGAFAKVPVIFGSNTDEFQAGCLGRKAYNLSNCGFVRIVPYLMGEDVDLDKEADLRRVLQYFLYSGRWQGLSDADFNKIVTMYPATHFRSGAERLSQMLVDSNRWIGHCSTLHAAQLIQAHS